MTQKKLKILFRTYGGKIKNKQTGLGHIFRCINLSYHLKQHSEIHFLVEDYGGVKKIINQYGFKKFSSLEKNVTLTSDIKKTIVMTKPKDILPFHSCKNSQKSSGSCTSTLYFEMSSSKVKTQCRSKSISLIIRYIC